MLNMALGWKPWETDQMNALDVEEYLVILEVYGDLLSKNDNDNKKTKNNLKAIGWL